MKKQNKKEMIKELQERENYYYEQYQGYLILYGNTPREEYEEGVKKYQVAWSVMARMLYELNIRNLREDNYTIMQSVSEIKTVYELTEGMVK